MRSLQERKAELFKMWEDGCDSCGGGDGGMSVGDDGYTGASDAAGPTAGYDPVMKKINRIRKKRKNCISNDGT